MNNLPSKINNLRTATYILIAISTFNFIILVFRPFQSTQAEFDVWQENTLQSWEDDIQKNLGEIKQNIQNLEKKSYFLESKISNHQEFINLLDSVTKREISFIVESIIAKKGKWRQLNKRIENLEKEVSFEKR